MNAVQGRSIVIVAYRPRPGKEAELLQLTREHLPLLRAEGLATSREFIACRAADGTVVEVFEWEEGGIEKAHNNPKVKALWDRYFAACEIIPLSQLPEAAQMFAGFAPLALD
ncbi:MAG: hypothetical protein JF584_00250 [Acidobacteria bacterium]|nr:hypothetical protein [Acidobacteriota bacterium]